MAILKLKVEFLNELDTNVFDGYFYKQILNNVVNLIKLQNNCRTCTCLEQVNEIMTCPCLEQVNEIMTCPCLKQVKQKNAALRCACLEQAKFKIGILTCACHRQVEDMSFDRRSVNENSF